MSSRRVSCDSCAVLVINGVICHEQGCPNAKNGKTKKTKEEIRITRGSTRMPGLGSYNR
jgi:hypothetical protein